MAARTVCGVCKQSWSSKKEYDSREVCDETCCPNNYGLVKSDRQKVRQVINEAISAANEETKKQHTPVNLHVVQPLKHHHQCRCPRCVDEKRGYNEKGLGVTDIVVAPKVPQAKIRVYKNMVEVDSVCENDADVAVYLEVPKIQVLKIIPQGGKAGKKKGK